MKLRVASPSSLDRLTQLLDLSSSEARVAFGARLELSHLFAQARRVSFGHMQLLAQRLSHVYIYSENG